MHSLDKDYLVKEVVGKNYYLDSFNNIKDKTLLNILSQIPKNEIYLRKYIKTV